MSTENERQIRRTLEDRLRHMYLVDHRDITVCVVGTTVFLSGACDQWEIARTVDYVARQVEGVEQVQSRLHVRKADSGSAEFVQLS